MKQYERSEENSDIIIITESVDEKRETTAAKLVARREALEHRITVIDEELDVTVVSLERIR